MSKDTILFIGLDTAKEHTEVAYVGECYDEKPQLSTRIRSTKQGVEKLARQMQSKYPNSRLIFTYEAGPCGYWIYREISTMLDTN